ncbi:DUF2247 family protein [Paenibacillus sp. N1-5-1-14]|uniref:DUF2247 family protein n=1 Tax=Paenibacillus radicibacter TaxID=2972488 RepID=UPI002159B397|nr:DUF2247 family protein [Paenibacillus radicibacter]MCR8643944.1 DUF2247 family protein [Paenibacillus radicibacter]
MNTLNILLPHNYVVSHVNLTWSDLLFAVEHGFMTNKAAVEHAEYVIDKEQEPPQKVFDLAWVNSKESIYPYLNEITNQSSEQDGSTLQEKFLFLLLNWVFEHKEQFSDPLGMVETIYADFDYPEEISKFVRYMPVQQPVSSSIETNVERLYNNWEMFLEEEKIKYSK